MQRPRPTHGPGDVWDATSRPYSVVELDGHKLDVRVPVRYVDASGVSIDIESERLFVITMCLSSTSRCCQAVRIANTAAFAAVGSLVPVET